MKGTFYIIRERERESELGSSGNETINQSIEVINKAYAGVGAVVGLLFILIRLTNIKR